MRPAVPSTSGPSTSGPALPRRVALVSVMAELALPFIARPARAAAIIWRVAHNAPTSFPVHRRLLEAVDVIQKQSNGQMEVHILPGEDAGSPVGLLAQVQHGQIDAAMLSCQTLANELPSLAAPRCAFAFSGYDKVWPAIDGALGAYIRRTIIQRIGPMPMDRCWDFGFRHITTYNKAIQTAADLQGLRIRTQPEPQSIGLLQALKALPVTMPLDELIEALRSHAVDGQESLLELVQLLRLDLLQTNLAMTHHLWDGLWLCVSARSWSTLPSRLQDVVAGACNNSALDQRRDVMTAATQMRDAMAAHGIGVTQPDLASFRDGLRRAGYYRTVSQQMEPDGWDLLQKYAGNLTG